MATPRTQSVGGWVVLCARSLGGDVGGSHSRPRSREEQGRARLDGREKVGFIEKTALRHRRSG